MPHQWEGCELEVLPGLEDIVRDEISDLLPGQVQVTAQPRPGRLTVQVRGRPWRLERLRSIVAVHVTARFDVPRPKALLGTSTSPASSPCSANWMPARLLAPSPACA